MQLLPLLRRKLIVRQVFLSGAEIRIPTTARLESEAETDNLPALNRSPNPIPKRGLPRRKPIPGLSARKNPNVENGIPGNFWVEIRKFKIRHGTIYF